MMMLASIIDKKTDEPVNVIVNKMINESCWLLSRIKLMRILMMSANKKADYYVDVNA